MMTAFSGRARVVHAILAVAAASGFQGPAIGQNLIAERSFTGTVDLYMSRPGLPVVQEEIGVKLAASPTIANFIVAPVDGTPISVTYGFLEMPQGTSSMSLFLRGPGSGDSVLPRMILGMAQAGASGNSLLGFGWISGADAGGSFLGLVVLKLQETALPPPPPPPVVNPPSNLPAFDGLTLRVPAAWEVRKFEGWALRLARKHGTLPGGTSADVPAAWLDGVMQCHGAQGFVYEIPLIFDYDGFPNGSILYTPDGTWPGWESPDRWQVIARAGGYTKHVFR